MGGPVPSYTFANTEDLFCLFSQGISGSSTATAIAIRNGVVLRLMPDFPTLGPVQWAWTEVRQFVYLQANDLRPYFDSVGFLTQPDVHHAVSLDISLPKGGFFIHQPNTKLSPVIYSGIFSL